MIIGHSEESRLSAEDGQQRQGMEGAQMGGQT